MYLVWLPWSMWRQTPRLGGAAPLMIVATWAPGAWRSKSENAGADDQGRLIIEWAASL